MAGDAKGSGAPRGRVERFRPGGAVRALVGGLLELALASVLAGLSLMLEASRRTAADLLLTAAVVWLGLALFSFALAVLRARVLAAELDDEGVTLRDALGARRRRYDELSAVEVRADRARLVTREGQLLRVHGVRGREQARRFRARLLERAGAARPPGAGADRLAPPGNDPA